MNYSDYNLSANYNDSYASGIQKHVIFLSPVTVTAYRTFQVCLDPGHGDDNSGNSQFDPGAVSGFHYEKDYALYIERETYSWLTYFGTSVFSTRQSDIKVDPNPAIEWRWKIANARSSEVFVSFHLNSGTKDDVFAVYQQGKTNEQDSILLSKLILNYLQAIMNTSIPNIYKVNEKTRYNTLGVLNNFKGKAGILIEFGGIDSKTNRDNIKNNSKKIGFWVALGIYQFLNNADPKAFNSVLEPSVSSQTLGNYLKSWASTE